MNKLNITLADLKTGYAEELERYSIRFPVELGYIEVYFWISSKEGTHHHTLGKITSATLRMSATWYNKDSPIMSLNVSDVYEELKSCYKEDCDGLRVMQILNHMYVKYNRNDNIPSFDGKHWLMKPIPYDYEKNVLEPIQEFAGHGGTYRLNKLIHDGVEVLEVSCE